jgi:iron-sulfur cluster assembly protein
MITISDTASSRIKDMLASDEAYQNMFLRVGVNEGGCSGFSYSMGMDDEQKADDQVFEIAGLKVVVDKESSRFLYGVEIDYKESAMGGGFTIHNPNAIATCGCGSSFRTRADAGKPGEC